jgi:hypothetical protein
MTTPPNDGDVAVVKPHYLTEKAYSMGHDEFSDVEADSAEDVDFGQFTSTARWANVLAPRLRAMAGAADPGGKGTYTHHREVAAIHPGCEEDQPAEADLVGSERLFEALVDAYRTGALDSVEDTYYPDDSTFF